LIKEIFERFCNEYKIKISPKNKFKAKITTPFGGLDNDPISFTAEIDESYLILNDNYLIYRNYDKNFYDPTNTALDIINNILKTYNIDEKEFKFTKKIPLDSNYLKEEIIDYITALVRLQDITFLKREIIIKEFSDIVENFIKNNVNSKYSYFNQSLSPFDNENIYPVDIALSNDNKKFFVIHTITNTNKLNEATISMMYYRYETDAKLCITF